MCVWGGNLFRSCAQETTGLKMTAAHRGARQDALKARVYPARWWREHWVAFVFFFCSFSSFPDR